MHFYSGLSYDDVLGLTLLQFHMLLHEMPDVVKFFSGSGDASNRGTSAECTTAADMVGIDVPG